MRDQIYYMFVTHISMFDESLKLNKYMKVRKNIADPWSSTHDRGG